MGAFLVEHIWTNAHALAGENAFTGAVLDLQKIPFLPVIEIFGILLPLLFHSFYGIAITLAGKQNLVRYNYARNWLYVLQRVSGVLVLLFVLYHLWEFRVQKWLYGMAVESFYSILSAHLSATVMGVPLGAMGYLLGLLATVFHFSNGMTGFCMAWGITVSREAQVRANWLFASLGIVLFGIGAATVLHFATGVRPF